MRIIETTVATQADATRLAKGLVGARLAACVSISAQQAVYEWKKRLHTSGEFLLRIKTTQAREEKVILWLGREHPYEVPEIISLRAKVRAEKYKKWLVANTTAQKK